MFELHWEKYTSAIDTTAPVKSFSQARGVGADEVSVAVEVCYQKAVLGRQPLCR